MPDIEDVLLNLSHIGTFPPAASEVVAADMTRAKHAATRRRRRRFAVTVVGAFVVVATATAGPGLVGTFTDSDGVTVTSRATLVAYAGEQPTGFLVTTVPAGWHVVIADRSSFVLGPPGAGTSARGAGPSTSGPVGAGNAVSSSLRNRIAVSLQRGRTFPEKSETRTVDINGRIGELGHPLAAPGKLSDTRWLSFPSDIGGYVHVQVPASLGLSDDQIVTFAEGISVTREASLTGG